MNTIKKFLLTVGLSVALVAPTKAVTTATSVFSGAVFTNFPGLPNTALPFQVTGIIVATSSTNPQTLWFYDIPTNVVTNVVAAYTNTVSYLTNYSFVVTNYYGNVTTNTNYVLFDNTNNAVAAVTNTISPKIIITCPANSSYATPGGSIYYFYSGMWVSNANATGAGNVAAVTITYK